MSIKEFTKSGTFVLVALALVVALLPFAVEQIGDATGLFKFPAVKWVKGLFGSKPSGGRTATSANVNWEEQLKGLGKDFNSFVSTQMSGALSTGKDAEDGKAKAKKKSKD